MSVRMNKAWFSVATLAGAAIAAVCFPGTASAFWTRVHVSACHSVSNSWDLGENTGTSSIWVSCPIQDENDRLKTSAGFYTNISVEFYQANYYAMRCVDYWGATGGLCGAPVLSTNAGIQTLSPTGFAGWSTSSHYPYTLLLVPGKSGNQTSKIKGMTTGA